MKCPKCGKFDWVKDCTRIHGNPSRYFVVCKNDGFPAQCSKQTGTVFVTTKPARYVGIYVDVSPEHKRWLAKQPNKSAAVRAALDKAMGW